MVDIDKLILHTTYNAFKNNSVQRDNLSLPTSVASGAVFTSVVSFITSQPAAFVPAFAFSTDYDNYFQFVDSQYHNTWRPVSGSQVHALFSTTSLDFFRINFTITGTVITFTLYYKNSGGGTLTFNHPTGKVPITLIDYTLAN